MKTTQLALRLMRHSELKDIGRLPMDDAITLIDAINAGFQEYYDLAPSIYSKTTISTQLPAASTTTLSITNGQNVLDSDYFTQDQRGATIVIGDDPDWNEITGTDSILDTYKGTTGSQTATIYGDAVALLGADYRRVAGRPRLDNGDELCLNERLRERRFLGTRGFGKPRWYYVEPVGEAQGGKELLVLRVDPIPDQLYTVRMEVILSPLRVTYEDLVTPRDLPMPDFRVERMVLPIINEYLAGTVFWPKEKLDREGIEKSADRARQAIANMDYVIARPQSRVRTPYGW